MIKENKKTGLKLTARFTATIVLVVVAVVIINLISFMIVGYHLEKRDPSVAENGVSNRPEDITRYISKYFSLEDGQWIVQEEGKKILGDSDAWLQILDENGQEIFSYDKPSDVREKYTPVALVNSYKYVEEGDRRLIYIAEKIVNDKGYSYIVGFPDNKDSKLITTINTQFMIVVIKGIIIAVLVVDGVLALFFGWLLARSFTKPLAVILDGIKKLAGGQYDIHYPIRGIYKDVYYNMNNLGAALNKTKEDRKELDDMREQWFANISHDIKTPLASIQGYAEILNDDDYEFSKQEIKQYTEIIEKKSVYIKGLVDDLNLSTRLKNKKIVLNKETVNLVKFIRDIVIDILNDNRYCNSDIEFICNEDAIESDIDKLLFRRVITNILFNALVHNDSNVAIKVTIKNTDKTHIIIEDNGRGIKREELKYIFERYYRGTNTGESHKGSGLGMAISYEIIKNHGGDIDVWSEVGEGTKFDITL